jgi:hypothetical protein
LLQVCSGSLATSSLGAPRSVRGARLLWLATVLTAASLSRAQDHPAPEVRYANGRLTVRVRQVPLDQVMAAVERETGAAVHGELRDWREVTKRFDDLPLGRALDRLLGRQNFTLWYDADGRPIRIELLGLPQPPPPKKRPARAAATLAAVVAREPPVRVTPILQGALGRADVRVMQLLAAALRQPDASVRAEARRILLDTFARRAALRDVLRRSTGDELAEFLRPWPPVHVDALVREMRVSHDPGIRRVAILTELALRRARSTSPAVAVTGVPRPGG